MVNIDQKIAAAEKKIDRERQKLRDLKAQSSKQERRDDTRRKILYGAAYLAGLSTLSERQREQSLERIHALIRSQRDRDFLGISVLDCESGANNEIKLNAEIVSEGKPAQTTS